MSLPANTRVEPSGEIARFAESLRILSVSVSTIWKRATGRGMGFGPMSGLTSFVASTAATAPTTTARSSIPTRRCFGFAAAASIPAAIDAGTAMLDDPRGASVSSSSMRSPMSRRRRRASFSGSA